MEEIFINMGVSALLIAVKSKEKREKMRKVFLKVFKAIWLQFGQDEEFQAVVGITTEN
jgi:hypothetical protein